MTKSDLISTLEKKAHLTHRQAESILNICFKCIIKALYDDKRIEIRGFGTFANRNYGSYQGRNPQNGESVTIPPKKVPFFKAGKELKKSINLQES